MVQPKGGVNDPTRAASVLSFGKALPPVDFFSRPIIPFSAKLMRTH
jgi:hypothetical protein